MTSLTSSLSVLLRSLLGDFDYQIISKTNPLFAPVYYSSYVFIVVLVVKVIVSWNCSNVPLAVY